MPTSLSWSPGPISNVCPLGFHAADSWLLRDRNLLFSISCIVIGDWKLIRLARSASSCPARYTTILSTSRASMSRMPPKATPAASCFCKETLIRTIHYSPHVVMVRAPRRCCACKWRATGR
ncbi:hypothetical protein BC827DRAFT_875296 [Russula dissimulans]|nr:hypothetical protein BC827DRAFT_875296 [Russula dissimulans]